MITLNWSKGLGAKLCLAVLLGSTPQAWAMSENTGSTGSVTITKHATDAAKAFAKGDYATARDEYRYAIGLSPDTLEFYYGLYDVCSHSGEWDQVAFALDKIFSLDPEKKKQLGYEYGNCLYHLKRYDEAIPVLKQALIDVNLPGPKISLVVPPPPPPEPSSTTTSATTAPNNPGIDVGASTPDGKGKQGMQSNPIESSMPFVGHLAVPLSQVVHNRAEGVNDPSLQQYQKSYENAALRSESITVCEYEGYQKKGDIEFFNPPIAKYKIQKILKGPPLNRDLPIRYEFHDRSAKKVPDGWKFGDDKMPEKGSKWLIFIQVALPRDGAFDTYTGDYGRQPYTDENMNRIYALLENATNR
jgi:tetratricopeptide (TPR) repeat protein